MTTQTLQLDDRLHEYLLSRSLREPELLQRLRRETAELPLSRMQIAPEQGQFMALLAQLMGARRALEIGVFTGYSALCVARELPDDGRLVACDLNEKWTEVAQRYFREAGVDHRIDLRLAPALDTLADLQQSGQKGRFDFAFIDADKAEYIDYYEQILPLLRAGGLLAVDNTLWYGRVADPSQHDRDTEAIRAFNDHVRDDARVFLSLVPIGDGLTLCRKL
jgi:predicted O-methyltransferase YrrM